MFSNFQVVKSSLYQHLDVDWSAEMLLLFGGDHRDSRQVGANIIQHSQFLAEMHDLFFFIFHLQNMHSLSIVVNKVLSQPSIYRNFPSKTLTKRPIPFV